MIYLINSYAEEPRSWDAYEDFYLSPTVTGWTGATSPSPAGTAWGYYAIILSSAGAQIGQYFNISGSGIGAENMRLFSDYSPLGYPSPRYGGSGWANTDGGEGFGYYQAISSLGRYVNPWFDGAPGFGMGLTKFIWMQSSWGGFANAEGASSALTWTAPRTNTYNVSGSFLAGNQTANSLTTAIVDNTAVIGSRQSLESNNTRTFSYTKTYNQGDTVQFQVGNNFSTGNAAGLKISITKNVSP